MEFSPCATNGNQSGQKGESRMMDLGKVRDALIMGLNAVESAGWTRSQDREAQEIREAIAELEKPAETSEFVDSVETGDEKEI